MKLTTEWLKQKGACTSEIDWFLAQQETEGMKYVQNLFNSNKT